MFDKLEIMRMAQAMAGHASTRQATIAQNVANADTPGYKARDVVSFAATYRTQDTEMSQRATRPGHFGASGHEHQTSVITARDQGTMSPNGNSVSIETELMKASQNRHEFETALSIYKTSLNILRTSIGRG